MYMYICIFVYMYKYSHLSHPCFDTNIDVCMNMNVRVWVCMCECVCVCGRTIRSHTMLSRAVHPCFDMCCSVLQFRLCVCCRGNNEPHKNKSACIYVHINENIDIYIQIYKCTYTFIRIHIHIYNIYNPKKLTMAIMSHIEMRVPVRPSPARQCTAITPFSRMQISKNARTIWFEGVEQSWNSRS